jgi:hypothetical protein
LLPCSNGRFVKFALVNGTLQFLPGAPGAVAAACACGPERNNYGRGHPQRGAVQVVIKLKMAARCIPRSTHQLTQTASEVAVLMQT